MIYMHVDSWNIKDIQYTPRYELNAKIFILEAWII